ncbi:MAG: efflux RND transporter permease subunit [Planctomycetota bacterium]
MTRYLFENNRLIWLILMAILVAGAASWISVPRLEDPILRQRVAVVSSTLPGASPKELEATVAVPIESWLQEFPEVNKIRSNIRANTINVVVELTDETTDTDAVWASIESRLRANESQLPSGCQGTTLTVFPLKACSAILAILPDEEIDNALQQHTLTQLATELKSRILKLDGSESIDLFGETQQELLVEVTPESLYRTGLTLGMISAEVAQSNRVAAGSIDQQSIRFSFELAQNRDLGATISKTKIPIPGQSESIRLGDLASISKGVSPRATYAMIEGRDAVVLGCFVDEKSRVDLWTRELLALCAEFEQEFPASFSIKPIFLQSEQVEQRLSGLFQNLLIAAGAVILIVTLMMGWRCMLVVAISLPLSSCMVLCGLVLMEIPIHQMSVTGLIVALGLLIDNAIVMVEEVRAGIVRGMSPLESATDAISKLAMPLLASTLTTILSFLPIALLPGPSGEFVGSIAVSVILALASSFLLSVTIIPPLVLLTGVDRRQQGLLSYGLRIGWLESLYRFCLRICFRFPWVGVLLGCALPVIGFVLSTRLQPQFFPATDRAQIQVEVELPAASTIDATRTASLRASQILSNESAIKNQYWFIGQSAPTFYYNVVPRRRGTPFYAQAFVEVDPSQSIDSLAQRLQETLDAELRGGRVVVRKLEQGPPFDAPIEIRIVGDELAVLEDSGNEIRKILTEIPEVVHTRADLGDTLPKFVFQFDDRMSQQGPYSSQETSQFIYSAMEGISAGAFFQDGDQVDVRIAMDFQNQDPVELLPGLPLGLTQPKAAAPSMAGQPPMSVTMSNPSLGSLGQFESESDVGAIIRLDGKRVNEVKAYLRSGTLPSVVLDDFRERLANSEINLPDDYAIEIGGEAEQRSHAIYKLISNAAVLVTLMVVVLVAALGSFRATLMIVCVAGLSVGLAPLALTLFNYPFGFMAILGAMGLLGVAVNDSIVVFASIRKRSRHGDGHQDTDSWTTDSLRRSSEELVDVVVGCTRHILTTSLTTMIGFLPLLLDGGKFWPPLAIVIASGIAGATVLALLFVPSVYLLLFRDSSLRN